MIAVQVSIDGLVDKQKVVYIYRGILFTLNRGGGPLTCAAMWMNLEDIMLSETRHSQKDNYCMISLI